MTACSVEKKKHVLSQQLSSTYCVVDSVFSAIETTCLELLGVLAFSILPLSNAFTVLLQHRMSNVFPQLLSINVFALLSYMLELCLKQSTEPPWPRESEWPHSTSNHCQCKRFLSKARPLQTLYTAGNRQKEIE